MQDKEFDELFRAQLNDLEVKPSAAVWEGITTQLDTSKRKKLLMPLLSIAATILVLVAAGVLFIPHGGKTSTQHPDKNNLVKVAKPINTLAPAKNSINAAGLNPAPAATKTLLAAKGMAKVHQPKIENLYQPKRTLNAAVKTPVRDIEQQQPVNTDDKQLIASNTPKHDAINAVVPGDETPLLTKQVTDDTPPAFITKPVIAATQLPAVKHDAAPVKKHRLNTLGDLINVVVATVDKRKHKIIEFTDTDDDDESNITSVNLGIFKIKKESDK